jgi:hypothetical protein
MADLYKYRIKCTTDDKYEYVWLDDAATAPTTCPIDTGHAVDVSSVSIVDTLKDALSYDAHGNAKISASPPEGTSKTFVTHDWADKTTWYTESVQVLKGSMTTSDGYAYYASDGYDFWIDTKHGKIFEEDQLPDTVAANSLDGYNYDVNVFVDDTHTTSGFEIFYADGYVQFDAYQGSNVIEADFYYENGSAWYLEPDDGKEIRILSAEVQFSDDVILNDTTDFQLEVYYPPIAPPPFRIPYGQPSRYKGARDFLSESSGTYPTLAGFGGPGFRGLQCPVITIPWKYVASKDIQSSVGARVKVYLLNNTPHTGEFATATFYCLVQDEE